MKFLNKNQDSVILKEGLTYKENAAENNRKLNELLRVEQKNFCAYTEKYMESLDSVEVEHFDSSKKYSDNYYNYYAVLRKANEYKIKKDKNYVGAPFFESLFFQNDTNFQQRVTYADGIYYELNEEDTEAKELIDFLGFNEAPLYEARRNHIKSLKKIFEAANWDKERQISFFRDEQKHLSFITAIEQDLGLDLSEFYTSTNT
jgi:hypothetical protein